LAAIQHNLGILFGKAGRVAEAERAYREALAVTRSLADRHPELTTYQSSLVNTMDDVGTLYQETGRRAESEAIHREVLPILQRLADRYPEVLDHAADLAGAQVNLAQALRRGGKAAESQVWFDRSIATARGVVKREPRYAKAREYLSIAHEGRALALKD